MKRDLYAKLSDLNLLRKAWHLAREDAKQDFLEDAMGHADFAARLDEYLHALANALEDGSYHPKPLLWIDVPKSSLSVRPGSVLSIEDRIVLFAIIYLIAPRLDRKLPRNVHSWRIRKNKLNLFNEHEILRFPFLRGKTVRRYLELSEPWYDAWPQFIHKANEIYRQGFKYMVISDIASYFENIHLGILRDLLLGNLPGEERIVHFLIDLLEYWSWPTAYGSGAPVGIPQGNKATNFLGNIYLLPLDRALVNLEKKYEIKYVRYMDDIKIFSKNQADARRALFLMNEILRTLRLNIQSAKTRILIDKEIYDELIDDRIEKVNIIINSIQKYDYIDEINDYVISCLKEQLRKVRGQKSIIRDKELRLYRRIMTGFTLLRHSGMINSVLSQLSRNPDYKLLKSSEKYIKMQTDNHSKIAKRLLDIISFGDELFPYQQARLLGLLRYIQDIPPDAWKLARYLLKRKTVHWYIRQQAALLLSVKQLTRQETKSLHRWFDREREVEVKRALAQGLAQLPADELEQFVRKLVFSTHPSLQRIGRWFHDMIFDQESGFKYIESYFHSLHNEHLLIERIFELEVISKARKIEVRKVLFNRINNSIHDIHHSLLKKRLNRIAIRLMKEVKQ